MRKQGDHRHLRNLRPHLLSSFSNKIHIKINPGECMKNCAGDFLRFFVQCISSNVQVLCYRYIRTALKALMLYRLKSVQKNIQIVSIYCVGFICTSFLQGSILIQFRIHWAILRLLQSNVLYAIFHNFVRVNCIESGQTIPKE